MPLRERIQALIRALCPFQHDRAARGLRETRIEAANNESPAIGRSFLCHDVYSDERDRDRDRHVPPGEPGGAVHFGAAVRRPSCVAAASMRSS